MKNRMVLLCVVSVLVSSAAFAQTATSPATAGAAQTASIAGVWRGAWGGDGGGLPCLSLTVSNETGKLSGAILFYLLRKERGQAATSTPGIPEPLIDPKFDGTTLTFQVSHRRAHPPATLNDPPIRFRLTLTGTNTAALNNLTEPLGDGSGSSGISMRRTEY